ncbi:hypothetical protein C2E20_5957 [Micractinium conductrix]|uniref:Synergin gamma C-terminal domain-containing protein n=1 Tax=Micractinium conductrix TaxID=554055 RepID=A0A2P6V909_9CHLO|nr:hypothetical protein C2E20_5957 [Micractinium conductrix]|eukprot:PSC70572.1 hypothetical protein C2E20_5957 [Micractinium conductrix]
MHALRRLAVDRRCLLRATLITSDGLQPQPAPQQPAPLAAAPPASGAAFAKRQHVWYLDGRTGAWLEAQVVHVDLSIQPPSYGIELPGGSFRETEQHRLRPCVRGGAAPQSAAAAAAPTANGHAGSAPVAVPAAVAWPAAVDPPSAAPKTAAGAAAAAASVEGDEFGEFAAPEASSTEPAAQLMPAARAAPAAEEDYDDFCSFQAAGGPPPPSAAPAAAPLPPAVAARTAAAASPARSLQAAAPPLPRPLSEVDEAAVSGTAAIPGRPRAQQQQQQQQDEGDFGDFEAAGALQAPLEHQWPTGVATGPPPAAVPAGVRRNAPLPLGLFGEEDAEEAAAAPTLGPAHWQPQQAAQPVQATAAAPALSMTQQQQGWAPLAAPEAGAVGSEVVSEYAVAWARLLEAAAQQLKQTAKVWAEAGQQGCWRELRALPAAQQHLAACGQLYCCAAVVRLAAQQLGLFTLVAELQEGWAQAEAAWRSMPQHATSSGQGAQEEQRPAADTEGAAEAPEEDLQPPFREAVFAAAHAWAAAAGGEAAEQSDAVAPGEAALPLLRAVAAAPAALEALSLDEFPRMLAWSEGLCGLTLLPLSLYEDVAPVAPWPGLEGRPCLVPLAALFRSTATLPPSFRMPFNPKAVHVMPVSSSFRAPQTADTSFVVGGGDHWCFV